MKFILDSHTFIWLFADASLLTKKTRELIIHDENELFLSVASIWEIGLKHSLGKLSLPESPREYILSRTSEFNIKILEISASDAFLVNELELIHRDPFDRMIIAKAKQMKVPVISNDKIFDNYGVKRVW